MPEYDRFYLQLSSPQTRSPAHSESLRWCKLIDWVRCESGACKCDGDTCHCDSLPVMQINIIYWVRCQSVVWTCNGDTCHSLPVLFGKFGLCRISSHRHLNDLCDKENQEEQDDQKPTLLTRKTRRNRMTIKINALDPTLLTCLQCQCWLHRCTSSSGVQCHQRWPTKHHLQRSKNQPVTIYKVSAIMCD